SRLITMVIRWIEQSRLIAQPQDQIAPDRQNACDPGSRQNHHAGIAIPDCWFLRACRSVDRRGCAQAKMGAKASQYRARYGWQISDLKLKRRLREIRRRILHQRRVAV